MKEFYISGMIVAFILGVYMYYKTEDKHVLQIGMLAPMALLSWLTVLIIASSYIKRK